MNIVLKFGPNADVSDEYLDKKLASYGLMNSVNVENQSSSKSDVQQVTQEMPQSVSQQNEVKSKSSDHAENKQPNTTKKSSKKKIFIVLSLIIGVIGCFCFRII